MYSKTEICNMALDNFGSGRITALDEDTEQARLLRNVYDNCRQSLLAKGLWNFATGYEVLNKIYDDGIYHPVFPEIYIYPVDTIKIVKVFSCEVDFADRYSYPDFEVFSYKGRRYIGTFVPEAKAQIIRDIDSPELYSPEFVTCFTYLLASRIAEALTRNGQIVQEMEMRYQEKLSQAMLTNAVEKQQKTQYPDFYTRFRNSTGTVPPRRCR